MSTDSLIAAVTLAWVEHNSKLFTCIEKSKIPILMQLDKSHHVEVSTQASNTALLALVLSFPKNRN